MKKETVKHTFFGSDDEVNEIELCVPPSVANI